MARLGRYFIPGLPLHVVQRGNDRGAIFFASADYEHYREWLHAASAANGCTIHAYVLLSNQVHLLVTPRHESSLPKTMQSLGRRYVRHVNAAYGRSGTLWEGRYHATLIDPDAYLFDCMRYIELAPVRAKLAARPDEYRWSSYGSNALGNYDPLVKPHALYVDLAKKPLQRQRAYRALYDKKLTDEFIAALRGATNGGWPLGSDLFKQKVALALGRRVVPLSKGRPPRNDAA
jgi:putative transposase